MASDREIAAIREACPGSPCRYPACQCTLPIAVRAGLAGAAAWDAAHGAEHTGIGMSDRSAPA